MPCFNVTTSDFNPQPKTPANDGGSSTPAAVGSSAGGLTTGDKAGIAVGTIVGCFAVVGILAFALLRKKRTQSADDVESSSRHASQKGANDTMSERSSRV